MALGSQPRWTVRSADTQVGIDVGLRDYMLRVYNYMASGLALTGIVAYVAAYSGFYESIARTPLIWLVILAPLGLVMLMSIGPVMKVASTPSRARAACRCALSEAHTMWSLSPCAIRNGGAFA